MDGLEECIITICREVVQRNRVAQGASDNAAEGLLSFCCRAHIPFQAWQSNQAITVDTSRGAIDLEPSTGLEYALWVLGLNAAMLAKESSIELANVSVDCMLWSPEVYVMSN